MQAGLPPGHGYVAKTAFGSKGPAKLQPKLTKRVGGEESALSSDGSISFSDGESIEDEINVGARRFLEGEEGGLDDDPDIEYNEEVEAERNLSPSRQHGPQYEEGTEASDAGGDKQLLNGLSLKQKEKQKAKKAGQRYMNPTKAGKTLTDIFGILKLSTAGDNESIKEIVDRMVLCAKRIQALIDQNTRVITYEDPKLTANPKPKNLTEVIQESVLGEDSGDVESIYQPRCIRGVLARHQIEGLNWLICLYKCRANGLLADQMGLGKTIQAIAFLGYLKEVEGITGQHLIIAPLSVVDNWKREFNLWYPECRVQIIRGIAKDANINPSIIKSSNYDVLITSYDGLKGNINHLMEVTFKYFIVDEAQKIKNEKAQLSDVARRVISENRLLLSGTPLSNDPSELWSLLNFIMPRIFDKKEIFEQLFKERRSQATNEDGTPADISTQELVRAIHWIIKPFTLRRLKHDTTIKLRPKREIHVFCPMSQVQKRLYKKILFQAPGFAENKIMSRTILTLRQISIHPYLVANMFNNDETPEHSELGLIPISGKFIVLDQMVEKFVLREKTKILVFSQFTSVLTIVEHYLKHKRINFFRLDGQTKVDDRNKFMEEFNEPSNPVMVFILSTRTGGLGINLTAANVVIILDSDWNPQMDLQAMDRAHRMGQHRDVFVYRLITRDSIEEKIIQRQIIKLKYDFLLLEKGRKFKSGQDYQFSLNQLSEDEVKDLMYFGVSNILKIGEDEDLNQIIDIDKLLREAEANTEKQQKVFEKKIREFGELALEFQMEHNYQNFRDIFKKEDLGVMSFDELQKAYQEGEKRNQIKTTREETLKKLEFFEAFVDQPKPHQFYKNPELLVKLRALNERHEFGLRHRLIMKIDYKVSEENKAELIKMESEGFANWTVGDLNRFVHYSGVYGRLDIESIALAMGNKYPEEVYRYAAAFWSRLKELPDALLYQQRVEAGEHKILVRAFLSNIVGLTLQQISHSLKDAEYYTSIAWSPETEMILSRTRHQDSIKTSDKLDKYLLYAVAQVGQNAWGTIRQGILEEDQLQEDFFARTRSERYLKSRYYEVLLVYANQFRIPVPRYYKSEELAEPWDFKKNFLLSVMADDTKSREEKFDLISMVKKPFSGTGTCFLTTQMFKNWEPRIRVFSQEQPSPIGGVFALCPAGKEGYMEYLGKLRRICEELEIPITSATKDKHKPKGLPSSSSFRERAAQMSESATKKKKPAPKGNKEQPSSEKIQNELVSEEQSELYGNQSSMNEDSDEKHQKSDESSGSES